MKKLEVKNLTVSFRTGEGELQAVRDVSFCLNAGETLAIAGESGSGKSVTARAVMGILSPNAAVRGGEIWYGGKDLLKIPEKEFCMLRGHRLAMVFQDPFSALDPVIKVGKQLTEAMLLGNRRRRKTEKAILRLSKAQAKQKAIELMREVGIADAERCFDRYPFELSGGQRQRIVIAIALSADPDVLICDEPTTALDVTIQAQILELIGKLKRERKLSVIFITHDMGVVANMADRVAIMYAGKIVEYGTAEDVFYDPRHPYTWALLSSMPDMDTKDRLEAIPGTPPDMTDPPAGDAFAARNPHAMEIDFERQPPEFQVSDTHWAATWLLHPDAPKVMPPESVAKRIEKMRSGAIGTENGGAV